MSIKRIPVCTLVVCGLAWTQTTLPNGWKLSPAGKSVPVEDMVLSIIPAPDDGSVVSLQGGHNDEGLAVIDADSDKMTQKLPLPAVWLGMAWDPDGRHLYCSGGPGGKKNTVRAPIYAFAYKDRKLSAEPVFRLDETVDPAGLYWSGLAAHPTRPLLFAANRGTGPERGSVVVFDTRARALLRRIPVEVNPYQVVLSGDAKTLFVSNWASSSVSIIDVESMKAVGRVPVGGNPNDMQATDDGRLFVACANDNSVVVIDTRKRKAIERISTALFPQAPSGSTPNALALDRKRNLLFAANADNNDVAVIDIKEAGRSEVLGFIPSGWYPSALAICRGKLYIGNSRGEGSYPDIYGTDSPLPKPGPGKYNLTGLRRGSIRIVELERWKQNLREWTRQVYRNTPYTDELLTVARGLTGESVVPTEVGAGSPIRHVVYIIKENRTYDQILGDIAKGNGDARLTIFGEEVTPNHHALANQFVLLDNLYADGEVSAVGHSWSDAAYATDFAEKLWPVNYSGRSRVEATDAYIPPGGFIWDLCRRKGLTYRSYGEYGIQVSGGQQIEDALGASSLIGHYAPGYRRKGMRDTDNAALFLREFAEFEKNYDNTDPRKRLPAFTVMSLPEDHTKGTTPGEPTPRASVASNDYALGQIVERLSHSRYWPEMAIFVIEDDAQNGPDHCDARRTVGFAISPYIKRGMVDSTQYSTSSFLRTMELLLGLPPMTQFDAAATPLYASFGAKPDLTPYRLLPPRIDLNARNTPRSYGAAASLRMDFEDVDRTPMFELNEILWKSIKGPDSAMPLPVHGYLEIAADERR